MRKIIRKKKIISFSLWGDQPKYTIGAICNTELAKIIYPGWICRFYCGESTPQYIIDQLKNYDNTEVIMMGEDKKYSYAMWRFLVADDEDVEIFLCRDADSRLSYRERYCVGIFEDSDYLVHSIRDNINHGALLAGMWGMKNNKRTSMKNLIQNFDGNLDYGQDEVFLRNIFGPHYDDTTLIHCSTRLENFPIENDISKYKIEPLNEGHKHFVGEVFCHTNYGRPYNHIFY